MERSSRPISSRPDLRRSSPLPDEPGIARRSRTQHNFTEGIEPTRPGQPSVERFGWRFQIRDQVIQTENNYDKDIFNGDVGIVERVDLVEQQVTIRFDERKVKYDFRQLDDFH